MKLLLSPHEYHGLRNYHTHTQAFKMKNILKH